MNWQEFAWYGIRFKAPRRWQIGEMGPCYLMLEDDAGPALELKWGKVKGRFSHQKQLRRLRAFQQKKIGEPVKECPVPTQWQEALDKYDSMGFSWRGVGIGGKGVLLHCATCRTATLIQFYHKGGSQPEKLPRRILYSFRDHREDNLVTWSLYDIRAILPDDFNLMKFRFEAGELELAFGSKLQKLNLHRWGPAATLLKDRDLIQFAQALIPNPWGIGDPESLGDGKAVEWRIDPPSTTGRQLWGRINRKPLFQWLRLWHLEDKNRILGVRIRGKKSINSRFIDWVCENYETL